jgi:phosphotransacetylase
MMMHKAQAQPKQRERYMQELFRLWQRRGMTLSEARKQIDKRNIFGIDDAPNGRCRCPGIGRDATFPGYDPAGA